MTANKDIKSNRLLVKVNPGASRNEIAGFTDGVLQVRIAAPPVKGKANKELIAFLSRSLGVKKSAISIIKGQTSRDKVIVIAGLGHDDVLRHLTA